MQIQDTQGHPTAWNGEIEGRSIGSGVSIIFNSLNSVGEGPKLHRHPYTETFILRNGIVSFVVGAEEIEAKAGQVVVVPAGVAHKFTSKSGHVEMIDIHANSHFITDWLESEIVKNHYETGKLAPHRRYSEQFIANIDGSKHRGAGSCDDYLPRN
jgi:mannose-6-phosphate isomerase-like protein (cupin superfamily)